MSLVAAACVLVASKQGERTSSWRVSQACRFLPCPALSPHRPALHCPALPCPAPALPALLSHGNRTPQLFYTPLPGFLQSRAMQIIVSKQPLTHEDVLDIEYCASPQQGPHTNCLPLMGRQLSSNRWSGMYGGCSTTIQQPSPRFAASSSTWSDWAVTFWTRSPYKWWQAPRLPWSGKCCRI